MPHNRRLPLTISIEQQRYDASLCGQTVSITNLNKGITINAVIADMCPGCGGNANSLDLSIGSWEAIGQSTADGSQVPITWTLLSGSGSTPSTTIQATTSTTTKATSTSTTTAPAATTTAASTSGSCAGVAAWSSAIAYTAGQEVTYSGALWSANWWTEAGMTQLQYRNRNCIYMNVRRCSRRRCWGLDQGCDVLSVLSAPSIIIYWLTYKLGSLLGSSSIQVCGTLCLGLFLGSINVADVSVRIAYGAQNATDVSRFHRTPQNHL